MPPFRGIDMTIQHAHSLLRRFLPTPVRAIVEKEYLERYEWRWQERLGQELRVGDWLRQLVTRCTDAEIDTLVRAFAAEDVQAVIRKTARFNWHRSLILSLVRQKGIAALLFRSLFR